MVRSLLPLVFGLSLLGLSVSASEARGSDAHLRFADCFRILDESVPFYDGTIRSFLAREKITAKSMTNLKELMGVQDARLFVSKSGRFRFVVKDGATAMKERAAYLIDQKLGFNLVPQTELFEIDGKTYSAQKLVGLPNRADIEDKIPDDVVLFGALTLNEDRDVGGHNYLKVLLPAAKTEKFIAIDNGLMAHQPNLESWLASGWYRIGGKGTFTALVKRNPALVERLREWKPHSIRSELQGLLSGSEIEALIDSRQAILDLADG